MLGNTNANLTVDRLFSNRNPENTKFVWISDQGNFIPGDTNNQGYGKSNILLGTQSNPWKGVYADSIGSSASRVPNGYFDNLTTTTLSGTTITGNTFVQRSSGTPNLGVKVLDDAQSNIIGGQVWLYCNPTSGNKGLYTAAHGTGVEKALIYADSDNVVTLAHATKIGELSDTVERNFRVRSGSGQISMYASASGNKGIYSYDKNLQNGKALIYIDSNNQVKIDNVAITTINSTTKFTSTPNVNGTNVSLSGHTHDGITTGSIGKIYVETSSSPSTVRLLPAFNTYANTNTSEIGKSGSPWTNGYFTNLTVDNIKTPVIETNRIQRSDADAPTIKSALNLGANSIYPDASNYPSLGYVLDGNNLSDAHRFNEIYAKDFNISSTTLTSGTGNAIVAVPYTQGSHTGNGGYYFRRSSSSSLRYKKEIKSLSKTYLDKIHKLYDIEVKQWKYKKDYLAEDDPLYEKLTFGYIAEDLESVLPDAVFYENGEVENYKDRIVLNALAVLVKEQHEEIEALKKQVSELLEK